MCGIIGIIGTSEPSTQKKADAMLATLALRGPDDRDTRSFAQGVLGQTRLSIIDLTSGHQPMRDNTHDLTISFNGEIYNYRALREELKQKGHRFTTQSDTEVILKAYKEFGMDVPTHLEGMFAFAIWDGEKQQLFVARDRFGEKPFYYAIVRDTLIFASEIKAILATDLVKPAIDKTAIDNYLALLYIPPWRTAYQEIHPLLPAHWGIFKAGGFHQERYWQLRKKTILITDAEASEEVRRLLTASVKDRLLAADVEVGTFLSGGIDSSIVSALAAQASSKKIKTFSAGFEDFINELPYARAVADRIGSEHHEQQIQMNLIKMYRDVSHYFDEPFADSSNIPTALISQFARQHVKTILSGDGGDELFWGYGHYRRHFHLRKVDKLTQLLFSDPFKSYKQYIQNWKPEERRRLWKDTSPIDPDPASAVDISEAETDLERINLLDIYMALPGDMLTKVDRSSMMHSLEVRAPFLNHPLAEFAYNLPAHLKTDRHRGKIILEPAFGDLLPKEVFTRKKQGFGAPIKYWLHQPAFKNIVQTTLTEKSRISELFHWEEIKRVLGSFYAGQDELQHRVWALLSLELWFRTHEL